MCAANSQSLRHRFRVAGNYACNVQLAAVAGCKVEIGYGKMSSFCCTDIPRNMSCDLCKSKFWSTYASPMLREPPPPHCSVRSLLLCFVRAWNDAPIYWYAWMDVLNLDGMKTVLRTGSHACRLRPIINCSQHGSTGCPQTFETQVTLRPLDHSTFGPPTLPGRSWLGIQDNHLFDGEEEVAKKAADWSTFGNYGAVAKYGNFLSDPDDMVAFLLIHKDLTDNH